LRKYEDKSINQEAQRRLQDRPPQGSSVYDQQEEPEVQNPSGLMLKMHKTAENCEFIRNFARF
jgi:hypothetical protein